MSTPQQHDFSTGFVHLGIIGDPCFFGVLGKRGMIISPYTLIICFKQYMRMMTDAGPRFVCSVVLMADCSMADFPSHPRSKVGRGAAE